jgi:hypothetical protein
MQIKEIKRPWDSPYKQGKRNNPDPFYHTQEWKRTRTGFIASPPWQQLPPINGKAYSNHYCAPCWREGKITPMHTVDHIQRIKAGGSRTDHHNLESQCKHHHAIKSANESNECKA